MCPRNLKLYKEDHSLQSDYNRKTFMIVQVLNVKTPILLRK
jgi:hypothetical protein